LQSDHLKRRWDCIPNAFFMAVQHVIRRYTGLFNITERKAIAAGDSSRPDR
jgi:hypothetical protein